MPVGTQDLQFNVLARVVGGQAVDGLRDSIDKTAKSAEFMKEATKLLAEFFAVDKIVEFGRGILDTAESLQRMSQKTGASVEALAGLQGAANLADVPLENLAKGLNKLSLNMVEATNGNQELSGTFRNLGINLKDGSGQLKNSGDVVKELADKFSQLKDGPEKAAVAMKLFGKSGADFIPVLNEGSAALEEFGLNIDSDFANRATTFNDTIKKIGTSVKNGAIDNLKLLLPTLQDLGDAFLDFTKSGGASVTFMDVLAETGRTLAIGFVASFTAIKEVIDGAVTGFREAYAFLKGNEAEVARLDAGLQDRIRKADAAEEAFIRKATKNSLLFGDGSYDDIKKRQQTDTEPGARRSSAANTDAIGENAKIVREFEQKIAKLRAEADATDQSNASKETAVLLAELEAKGISKSSQAYQDLAVKITSAVNAQNVAKEKLAADNFAQKQKEELELQVLQLENYDKSSAELAKLTEAKKLDNQAAEATKKFTAEGTELYLEQTEAIKEQKLALIDLQEQQKQTWTVGAKTALRDYLESARNVSAQVKDMFAHAFSNMEDSLVSFVKTGKLDFAKFADDIITDLIRIQVKAALVQAITGIQSLGSLFFSGSSSGTTTAGGDEIGSAANTAANGGIMTAKGMVNLGRYAKGGVAYSPQVAVFGEGTTPEAYVPLPDGKNIPVTVKGAGGGDNNVTVHVNMNGSDDVNGDSNKASALGKLVGNIVKQSLLNEKRPGGILT